MKNLLLLLTFSFCLFTLSAQEYADFEITGTNEGTGTFSFAALSNFSWEAIGAINALQIRDDEVFDDIIYELPSVMTTGSWGRARRWMPTRKPGP